MNLQTLPVVIKREIPNAKLPVEFVEGIRALAACETIDEAKYWNTAAEALAGWARLYASKEAAVAAQRLKAHAYRRMGELATELCPDNKRGRGRGRGSRGPAALLREHGLHNIASHQAVRIARMPKAAFDAALSLPRPPGIVKLASTAQDKPHSASYITFLSAPGYGGNPQNAIGFRGYLRSRDPKELARGIWPDEAERARETVREIQEWLDTFEQYLPKPK